MWAEYEEQMGQRRMIVNSRNIGDLLRVPENLYGRNVNLFLQTVLKFMNDDSSEEEFDEEEFDKLCARTRAILTTPLHVLDDREAVIYEHSTLLRSFMEPELREKFHVSEEEMRRVEGILKSEGAELDYYSSGFRDAEEEYIRSR